MATNYLSQGQNSENTYCKVVNIGDTNYAIYSSEDGTIVTCQQVAEPEGVYDCELQKQADENVIKSINALYDRSVNSKIDVKQRSLDKYIRDGLASINSDKFIPVSQMPKMTKSVATGLSSIKELAVLEYNDTDHECNFVCFGYRRPLAEYFDSENYKYKSVFVFPDRLYTAALFSTRFKTNFFVYYVNKTLIITDDIENFNYVSFLMTVEYNGHLDWLENQLLE